MGKVMFMRKGDVHTAPAAPVFLTDETGNLVKADSPTDNTVNAE